ncbi:MAG: S4 domain-containing protein [Candidatus Micrarchaeaceae archaeon]
MGIKANRRHIKRLASSKYMGVSRKSSAYVAKPFPGRHTKDSNIALKTILTEKLGLTSTSKEAEKIIKDRNIKVNDKIISNPLYSVGFGDIIEIHKLGEKFYMDNTKNGSFTLEKIKSSKQQLFKVIGKYKTKGNKLMLRLHDGSIINADKFKDTNVNDSVDVKNKEISSVIKLEEGGKCLVIKGNHTTQSGIIRKIITGTATRSSLVSISSGKENFETTLDNIIAIAE